MKKKIEYWNAIILAIIGGGVGLQEFYVNRTILGFIAVLFFWTGIPAIVGLVEAVVWLFEGEDNFDKKFNRADIEKKPLND